MKSSLPNPTKAESRRMEIIKSEIGCIACWIDVNMYCPPAIHHLLDTGRRRGHRYTIGLCEGAIDHHQGNNGIHRAKRSFREKYGTDDELLRMTNDLIVIFENNVV